MRELLLREKARDATELIGGERLDETVDELVADLAACGRGRRGDDARGPSTRDVLARRACPEELRHHESE